MMNERISLTSIASDLRNMRAKFDRGEADARHAETYANLAGKESKALVEAGWFAVERAKHPAIPDLDFMK